MTATELKGKQDRKVMEAFVEGQTWNLHHLRDQKEIVGLLDKEGIRAVGIGSVASKGPSFHDIDILILDSFSPETLFRVERTLGEAQAWSDTDWGGYFYLQTKFGNIDVFFLDRLMSLAESSPSAAHDKAIADELRALTAYPFNPSWKVSNKKRYEKCLENISFFATELEAGRITLTPEG